VGDPLKPSTISWERSRLTLDGLGTVCTPPWKSRGPITEILTLTL